MFPSVFLPAVIAQINQLNDVDRRLAGGPRPTPAERRPAGRLSGLRRGVRRSKTAPSIPSSTA